jgi:hypothetical protein
VASLYGGFFAAMASDYGLPRWFGGGVTVATIILVTYEAYQEEVRRYYPFLKVIGVNLLGLFLWFVVAFTKIYLLNILALGVVLFAIRYKCKKCVEYKRYSIG